MNIEDQSEEYAADRKGHGDLSQASSYKNHMLSPSNDANFRERSNSLLL